MPAEPISTVGGTSPHVSLWQRHHDLAIAESKVAVELDPNSARAHGIRAMILTWSGQPEDAIPVAETSMRLDPNFAGVALWARGHALYHVGRYADAEADLKKSALLNPSFMPAHMYLSATQIQLGKLDEAKVPMAELRRINPAVSQTLFRGYLPYRNPADLEMVIGDLRAAGLPE